MMLDASKTVIKDSFFWGGAGGVAYYKNLDPHPTPGLRILDPPLRVSSRDGPYNYSRYDFVDRFFMSCGSRAGHPAARK